MSTRKSIALSCFKLLGSHPSGASSCNYLSITSCSQIQVNFTSALCGVPNATLKHEPSLQGHVVCQEHMRHAPSRRVLRYQPVLFGTHRRWTGYKAVLWMPEILQVGNKGNPVNSHGLRFNYTQNYGTCSTVCHGYFPILAAAQALLFFTSCIASCSLNISSFKRDFDTRPAVASLSLRSK